MQEFWKSADKGKNRLAFLYASLGPLVVKQLALDSSVTAALGAEVAEIVRTLNPPLPSGEREGVRGIPSSQPSPLEVRGEGERAVMTAVLGKIYPVQNNKPRNPQIAGWLIKQVLEHKHNRKPIMAEDFYKIGEDFTYFESLKKSDVGIKTDLLRYANLTELRNTLEPFQKKKQQKESEELERHLPKEQRDKLMAETTVLYSGPEGKVVIPHTPESSIYWGNNTKWCIAGKDYAKTYFPQYNEKSPVIMILPAGKENDKIALVDKTLWNSADEQISALSPAIWTLMNKSLTILSPQARAGVEQWLPFAPETEPETQQQPRPQSQSPTRWQREMTWISAYDYRKIDEALWKNRDFMREAVRQNGESLEYAAPALKADPAIVLEAVRQYGGALEYAAPKLRADPAIVIEAVRQNGGALYCAAPALKADPAIVLEAVRQYGGALEHADPKLQADREIVLDAVRQDGGALCYAIPKLRADPAIVTEAVRQYGSALQYAGPKLRADPAIVLEAVCQDGGALKYAALELQADREIVIEAVRQYGGALKYAAPELQADREIVIEAVRQYGGALKYAAPELQADREIVLDAVRQNSWALEYAVPALQADREIVLEAVRQDGGALYHAASELKSDPGFVLRCLKDEDLVFKIRSLKEYGLHQPDDKTMEQFQIKALEQMAKRGDTIKFSQRARHFKAVWGDAEALFGGDPQKALGKIKSDLAGRYKSVFAQKKCKIAP